MLSLSTYLVILATDADCSQLARPAELMLIGLMVDIETLIWACVYSESYNGGLWETRRLVVDSHLEVVD